MSRFVPRRPLQKANGPKLQSRPPRGTQKPAKTVKPSLSTLRAMRPSLLTPDLEPLDPCRDAKAYVSWVERTFPEIETNPSSQALDKAMLALAKEYLYRRKYTQIHTHKVCLTDVFHERMERLLEKQLELTRHRFLEPPKGTRATLVPALYIGTGEEASESP